VSHLREALEPRKSYQVCNTQLPREFLEFGAEWSITDQYQAQIGSARPDQRQSSKESVDPILGFVCRNAEYGITGKYALQRSVIVQLGYFDSGHLSLELRDVYSVVDGGRLRPDVGEAGEDAVEIVLRWGGEMIAGA
jgi:hypothetical protein